MPTQIVKILFGSLALLGAFAASSRTVQAHEITATYAAVGDVTRTPYGWVDFCGRRPDECRVPALAAVDLDLSPKTFRILDRINRLVNVTIEPVSNMDHWGTILDHWDYPTDGKGDCKIYALEKRRQLLALGFPRQALLMTIVRDLEGNGPTILTARSSTTTWWTRSAAGSRPATGSSSGSRRATPTCGCRSDQPTRPSPPLESRRPRRRFITLAVEREKARRIVGGPSVIKDQ